MTIDEKLDKIYELKQMIKQQLLYKGYTEAEVGDLLEDFPGLVMRLNVCSIDDQPEWFRTSVVCWYDTVRQNITNEQLRDTPELNDYSGHGYNLLLKNFSWNESSGVDGTRALVFNGTSNLGIAGIKGLSDYTLIAHREWTDMNTGAHDKVFCSKAVDPKTGAFITDYLGKTGKTVSSFGASTEIIGEYWDNAVLVQSKNRYNGMTIDSGTSADSDKLIVGGLREGSDNLFCGKLYKLLLFNRTLTPDEVNYVRYIVMGEDFLSWEDGDMITFDDGSPIIF